MHRFEGVHSSLQAQAHIWNHTFNFINSMCLKCAVDLRIPDAIHKHGGQPVTLSKLLSALGISSSKADHLRRLMRLLTHSGFFTMKRSSEGEEEAYLLTSYSECLISDNPHTLSPLLRFVLDPSVLTPWLSLGAWFLAGGSPAPFHYTHGASLWEKARQTPEMDGIFNEAMAGDSRLMVDVIIREHGEVFRGLNSLVDVGGGNGATAMALAEAFPHLRCMVLEQPHVVASAPKSTAVEFMAGDMFVYVPPADAVLLKWILHDWNDADCLKLLKLCKEAISSEEEAGGKVIIVDMVVREDLGQQEMRETQYLFDLMMMMLFPGGKERTEEEWRKLFIDAGFSRYEIIAGVGLRAIVELYP